MATTKNITMKQFNGTDYDTLYPKTIAEQVDGIYGKDEILSNGTKVLYGLTDSAVPDNVLALLSRFNKGLGNEYVWEKIKKTETPTWTETPITSAALARTNGEVFSYADSFTVTDDGFTLDNPSSFTWSYNSETANSLLKGKYVQTASYNSAVIVYIPETATFSQSGSNLMVAGATELSGFTFNVNIESFGYVNSPDPNTYPPAVSDGYTYTPIGQMGAKANIATGSYTGTGTYGATKNSLTFDFEPLLLIVSGLNETLNFGQPNSLVYIKGVKRFVGSNGTSYQITISVNANTVSWYNDENEANQLNYRGATYFYLAIG